LEQAQVVAELVRALGDPGQHAQHAAVHLARVSLSGHRKDSGKAHPGRHPAVQFFDFLMVAAKQAKEAGLRAGRALAAQQAERAQDMVQVIQVQHQVLDPERGAFADGHRLSRLEMGVAQCRQVARARCEGSQAADDGQDAAAQELQAFGHQDQVGVVADITGGCPEMDDAPGCGALVAVGVDMGHDIVPDPGLVTLGILVVDRFRVRFQLVDLFGADRKAQLALGFSQGDPELAPGFEFAVR